MSSDAATAGFAQLYKAEVANVFAYLAHRSGDQRIAEDVTAEVFIEVFNRGDERLDRGLLFTVARRRLIDHWRREAAHRRRHVIAHQMSSLLGDGCSAAMIDRVEEALDSLPTNQRQVLVLRYLEGHSVGETADVLCLSYRAAESLLARARRSFRNAYEGGRDV